MITVHHLEHSRSQRVLWLLEELGLPYEVKRYARDKKTSLAPPELAAIHPLGKSPVIGDGKTVMAPVFNKLRTAPMPFFAKPIAKAIADKVMKGFVQPNIASQLAFMEAELATRPWFAGKAFSAADIMMSFPLEAAASRGGLDARYPKLGNFIARIHARPAYQRALERGGPLSLLES